MPADGWYILAGFNNGALDDVTAIGTLAASDSSANATQGTLTGIVDPTVIASPWAGFTQAFQFDGVNRGRNSMGINFGVGVPSVSGVGAAAMFTLEARVRTGAINTAVNGQGWIAAGRYSSGTSVGGAQPLLYVVQNGGVGSYRFAAYVRNNAGTVVSLIGATTAVAANTNYVVAIDYDGTTLRLYVNGVVEASVALSGVEAADTVTRFMIGRDDDSSQGTNGGFPWLGIIEEVRWSKVARYAGAYSPAGAPFVSDANTLLLAHLDALLVSAGAPGRDGVTRTNPTLGAKNVWTDISQWVLSGGYQVGRQHELNRFEAGTATLPVDNTLGVFTPWNTSSPFSGLLNVMIPVQIRKVWLGVTYIEYTGYVIAWAQKWPDQVNSATEIRLSDAFRMMALANVSGSVYATLVKSTSPLAYYRLGDIIDQTAVDSSGNGLNGTYSSGVQGVAGALLSDPDSAYDTGSYAGFVSLPGGAAPTGNAFTIKGWVKFHIAPDLSGNDRMYIAISPGASHVLSIYVPQSSISPSSFAGLYFEAGDSVHNTVQIGANDTYVDQAIPLDGKYHQWACTRDSSGLVYTIFVDGVQMKQVTLGVVIDLTGMIAAGLGCTMPSTGSPGIFTEFPQLNAILDEVSVHNYALAPAQILADYNAAVALWASSDSGTRLNNVLDTLPWPANARNIQTGASAVQAVTASLTGTKLLQYMQTIELTEAGALFLGPDGRVNFFNRNSIVSGSVSPVLVFGDGAGEFPFQPSPNQAKDDTDIWNESDVQRLGGQTQSISDPASIQSFGRRTIPNRSGLLYTSDLTSLYRAQWDVERYKQPVHRVSKIMARPLMQPNLVPTLLGLAIMSCVQVHRTALPGSPLQQNALIEGKTVNFDAETGDWTVEYALSPVEARPYWILGDATFGVLGSTTRLGF